MLAVIENNAERDVALLPIAGRPLLIRQLQWLRASAFDRVAVEVPFGAPGVSRLACLRDHPLGWDVTPVVTRAPEGAAAIARDAGFPPNVPVLAVPADVLGACDLARVYVLEAERVAQSARPGAQDLHVVLQPPSFFPGGQQAALVLVRGALECEPSLLMLPEWGARITSVEDAIEVGTAVLTGAARGPGLFVHAKERAPGVFVARGGHIHAKARIVAPVLVGEGAHVRAGAQVGPRVFLGSRAIVERGATLRDAIVEDDTVVGEKLFAVDAYLSPTGTRDAARSGRFVAVDDRLVLARRPPVSAEGVPLGLAALAAALSALGLGLLLQ